RRHAGQGVVKRWSGTVAAAHVEHYRAHAPLHRHLGAHAVGPEPVDLTVCKSLGGGDAKANPRRKSARNRRYVHLVPLDVYAAVLEQSTQPHFDPWRGADAASLDDT